MKKTAFLLLFIFGILSFAQKTKSEIYDTQNYEISVPDTWKVTTDDGIVNIFPTNEIGAVTVSEYHELNLPSEEIKKFILDLYGLKDDENSVKVSSSKKGFKQYQHEYTDTKNHLIWITRLFQKEKDFYLITINCEEKYWNGNYMKVFTETFNSFTIKK